MSQPFLGEIRVFSFPFAPKNWAFCNGQLLGINQNQALFSLMGTFYGGNGQTTFGLPNLQGRAAMHVGNSHTQGEVNGEAGHTLTNNEMPVHNHNMVASTAAATLTTPLNNLLAQAPNNLYGNGITDVNATLNAGDITTAGSSFAHNNLQPYLVLNFCVALSGIFPSRN
jgi:microcystin-dependent protein